MRADPGIGVPTVSPRVWGIDEVARRHGRRFGAILVDLEENAVLDRMPDRAAKTPSAWLRAHSGIEIIARDRVGAPDAPQVIRR